MLTPASLHGLQDWYLRASDGEWDVGPGIPVDPLDAGRAWADLPTSGARAIGRPEPVERGHASRVSANRP